MIEVKNLNKSFDETQVLKDISVSFNTGQTNLIIGQSGSGKTVLMKCIIALYSPDSGSISYDGRDVVKMKPSELRTLRQEMGMLFQGSALFDSMTVAENVMFPLEMFSGNDLETRKARVDFCLQRVELTHAHDLYPSEISGGMQKRAAIARAIALNPKYLFCDEPNSGLDPKTAIVIDKLIQEITREYNITTVINTHDMNSVMEIGENIVFIYKGEAAWKGSSDDLYISDNELLNDFVFASDLFKKIRNSHTV